MTAMRLMQEKLNRLVQGDRTITEYEIEFMMLFRYASHLIPNAEEKCHCFFCGLRDGIRQPLVPLGVEDYSALFERARKIKLDFQSTHRRRDFQKRKNEDESRSTQSFHSGRPNWKKPKPNTSESSTPSAMCNKCGRAHRGECLSGTNTCFWCHQPGHMSKSCPILGHKSTPEARIGSAPQRTVRRPRMVESTAYTPSQGQARQPVHPRVYGLSPQEAKDSSDVITGMDFI
ncbi:hypothetical protein MA16_Dca018664 [Dendrobium catenatum]|uniref:CCHC-type domain-containing protein n=1 Tax=Dendrobium catenatum TaxID=906689 RepID=A0A2I0W5W0_9ASPA|nr:hypothetical protein MA16_Dca018664 [Dendrobium catenatum]